MQYDFPNPPIDQAEIEARKIKLNPILLDPKTIQFYIGSKVIEKLSSRLRATRTEIVLYVFVGMSLAYVLQFFLLPLLGYHVSIVGR